MIELRQLYYFEAVARELHFADAGRQLVTTLPAALRRLEAVLADARAVGHAWEH